MLHFSLGLLYVRLCTIGARLYFERLVVRLAVILIRRDAPSLLVVAPSLMQIMLSVLLLISRLRLLNLTISQHYLLVDVVGSILSGSLAVISRFLEERVQLVRFTRCTAVLLI